MKGNTAGERRTIGAIAREARIQVGTLRFYERRGLIPKPPRSSSNYRLYPEGTVARVLFIRQAQDLGFTLEEIEDLLSLRAASKKECSTFLAKAQAKLCEVDGKIASLNVIKKALTRLIGDCPGKGSALECPILNAMEARK